jgi:hypothetical protein
MSRDPSKKESRQSPRTKRSAEMWPTVEEQLSQAMQRQGVSSAELARRAGVPRAGVCRDLKGGLSAAKLGRLHEIADAVRHDVFVCIVPRDGKARNELLAFLLRSLRHSSEQ